MTLGTVMYYGGMAGAALVVLALIILSKIFAVQRQKTRDKLNEKNE